MTLCAVFIGTGYDMYLVAIAWMYVVVMMAAAEATGPNGTVLGAVMTLLLYGLLPVGLLLYLMGTPLRLRARRAEEAASVSATLPATVAAAEPTAESVVEPDQRGHAPGEAVTAKREEA
jgi:uncharacterized membrane protein